MVDLHLSPRIESLYGLGSQATKLCTEFYNFCKVPILDNVSLKTLKLGLVAFQSAVEVLKFSI